MAVRSQLRGATKDPRGRFSLHINSLLCTNDVIGDVLKEKKGEACMLDWCVFGV